MAASEDAGLIKARHGICLDANRRSENGGKISMWACNSKNANQIWTYDVKAKQIKNKYGFCLQSSDRKNGAKVDMWRCDVDDHDQRWYLHDNGLVQNNNKLDNGKKLCLDASQRDKNGGKVHLWECNADNKNQHWDFDKESHVAIDDPDTGLVKAVYGKCLDANQRNSNGGKISMWSCNPNNANQQFVYDNKKKMIKNKHADKNGDFYCLRKGESVNGGMVNMWKCDEDDWGQKWWEDPWNNHLVASGVEKNSKKKLCLDASQRDKNGGKVHVWECNTANSNQRWKLDYALGVVTDEPETGLVKAVYGKCLDANQRTTNGGKVTMWQCSDNNKNQVWSYDAETKQIHLDGGFCLRNQEKENGGKVETWKCQKDDVFQKWWYDPSSGQVTSSGGKLCLDASQRDTNGGKVHVWACDETKNNRNQRWNMDTAGKLAVDSADTGFLKNQHGFCVDAHSRNAENGKVAMWKCQEGNKNQQWQYSQITHQIKNKFGKCLSHNSRTRGAVVDMNACSDEAPEKWNQKFYYDEWKQVLEVGRDKDGKKLCLDASQRDTASGKLHLWECDMNYNNNNQEFVFDYSPLEPVPCKGEYGAYGQCSKTCGGGKKTRAYKIVSVPQFGGKMCSIKDGAVETGDCNVDVECPEAVDIEMSIPETKESFTEAKQEALAEKIAKQLNLNVEDVKITVGAKANPVSRRLVEAAGLTITVSIKVLASQVVAEVEKLESEAFAKATGATFLQFKPTKGANGVSKMCATCKWDGKKIIVTHYINAQKHGEKGLQHKCYHDGDTCKCVCKN